MHTRMAWLISLAHMCVVTALCLSTMDYVCRGTRFKVPATLVGGSEASALSQTKHAHIGNADMLMFSILV